MLACGILQYRCDDLNKIYFIASQTEIIHSITNTGVKLCGSIAAKPLTDPKRQKY